VQVGGQGGQRRDRGQCRGGAERGREVRFSGGGGGDGDQGGQAERAAHLAGGVDQAAEQAALAGPCVRRGERGDVAEAQSDSGADQQEQDGQPCGPESGPGRCQPQEARGQGRERGRQRRPDADDRGEAGCEQAVCGDGERDRQLGETAGRPRCVVVRWLVGCFDVGCRVIDAAGWLALWGSLCDGLWAVGLLVVRSVEARQGSEKRVVVTTATSW